MSLLRASAVVAFAVKRKRFYDSFKVVPMRLVLDLEITGYWSRFVLDCTYLCVKILRNLTSSTTAKSDLVKKCKDVRITPNGVNRFSGTNRTPLHGRRYVMVVRKPNSRQPKVLIMSKLLF